VEATDAVVKVLRARVRLPEPFEFRRDIDPEARVADVASEIEDVAVATRVELGLDSNTPVDAGLVDVMENSGVVVVRDVETDDAIDAYSAVVNSQPIVVLDGGSDSVWDRDNFNLAHELGHLVMHRTAEHRPGTKTVESQAHRFAGAFLAPEGALRSEVPDDLDWAQYLELKIRWGMSMAALVHRARDLGIIDELIYTRAMKQRSAYGWRRVEPGKDLRPLPRPSLLAEAAMLAELTNEDLAVAAGIPESVVERILGSGPSPSVRT
jgi:Zn-dependent peptidase ImmA (M78 family)